MISLTVFDPGHVPTAAECRRLDPAYVLLATCQRVEVYHGDGAAAPALVRHVLRVTAGLESAHVGETEVQGQVREAYRAAAAAGHVSPGLTWLFTMALAIGRRVRSETHVSRGARSYAQGAFGLLRAALGEVRNKTITFVGVHTLQERIVARCRAHGCRRLLITSRTCAKGGRLAAAQRGLCFPPEHLAHAVALSDAVVVAVRAPAPLLTAAMLPRATPLVILDLSVPRAVADDVRALPQVRLLTLDDVLRRLVAARRMRRAAVPAAAAMIEQAVALVCAPRPCVEVAA